MRARVSPLLSRPCSFPLTLRRHSPFLNGLRHRVQSPWRAVEVLKERRAQPSLLARADDGVPVAAVLRPAAFRHQLMPGKSLRGERQAEAALRIRNVRHQRVQDLRHTCHKRLLHQLPRRIIKDPRAVLEVRLDHTQRISGAAGCALLFLGGGTHRRQHRHAGQDEAKQGIHGHGRG